MKVASGRVGEVQVEREGGFWKEIFQNRGYFLAVCLRAFSLALFSLTFISAVGNLLSTLAGKTNMEDMA